MIASRNRLPAAIPALAALLLGCGGSQHARHRAGAEPAVAPPAARTPTGFTQPGGVAAVGKDVAVVDVGADVVTFIDGRSLRVLGHVAIGAGIWHAVAGASTGGVQFFDPAHLRSLR